MKNGICIKCSTSAVYRKEYELHAVTLNGKAVRSESYVCTNCGYFETYVLERDALNNVVARAQKLGDWKKV